MAQEEIDPTLFSDDIREFVRLLACHGVRWLLVGGHAAIFHGHIRVTGDTDVFFDPAPGNCTRLFDALREFWGGDVPAVSRASELEVPGTVVQFGRPPNRLDLINAVDGVTFEEAFAGCRMAALTMASGRVPIPVIGRDAFVRNKRAAGRPKDLNDLRSLGE